MSGLLKLKTEFEELESAQQSGVQISSEMPIDDVNDLYEISEIFDKCWIDNIDNKEITLKICFRSIASKTKWVQSLKLWKKPSLQFC